MRAAALLATAAPLALAACSVTVNTGPADGTGSPSASTSVSCEEVNAHLDDLMDQWGNANESGTTDEAVTAGQAYNVYLLGHPGCSDETTLQSARSYLKSYPTDG